MDDVPRSINAAVYLIAIAALIIVGALFSGTETAISYADKIHIRTLAEDGNKRAKRLLAVIDRFDNALITLLILINVVHVVAASLSTVLAVSIWGDAGSVISTVVLTLLVFFFSETIPKNIAKANADKWAMVSALPMRMFMITLFPVALFFRGITAALKKFVLKSEKEPSITEDEFQAAVEDIEGDGVLKPQEGRIIRSAVEFSDICVKDVMTPRDDIVGINIKDPPDEIRNVVLKNKYSRFPVYYGTIDNIIGVLRSKSYLISLQRGEEPDIDPLILKPLRVTEQTPLDTLFEQMSRLHNHLAIVTDDDGTTLGIVTMEDALEVIVGEIYDEDEKTEVKK